MNHLASTADQAYLSAFFSFDINPVEFHHREHLRVAYTLLTSHSVEETYEKVKDGILGLLTHLGVGTEKYHETLTLAWVLAVHHFMHNTAKCRHFEEFIERNPVILDKDIMYTHYSRVLLDSADAKKAWVAPDIEPIPMYDQKLA